MERLVYLLRHGEAGYSSDDFSRTLTENGRSQTATVINRAKEQIERIDGIISSPYPRAQETAEIARSILSPDLSITELPLLTPESSPTELMEWLQSQSGDLLLVGHNPLMSRTLNRFIGADVGREHMDTSSIGAIKFEISAEGCGELLWLLHRF